jgi:hypothetical protein
MLKIAPGRFVCAGFYHVQQHIDACAVDSEKGHENV